MGFPLPHILDESWSSGAWQEQGARFSGDGAVAAPLSLGAQKELPKCPTDPCIGVGALPFALLLLQLEPCGCVGWDAVNGLGLFFFFWLILNGFLLLWCHFLDPECKCFGRNTTSPAPSSFFLWMSYSSAFFLCVACL